MVGRLLSFWGFRPIFRGELLVSGRGVRHATKNLRIPPSAPCPSLASCPDLATAEPTRVHGVPHRRILVIPKGEDVWWWWEPLVVWDPHGEFSTSTGLEGNKEKTQTKTEEDDLISLFVVNELIFFTWIKICIKPSHGSSWDKTTYRVWLGKKAKKQTFVRRLVGNQVVILRWDWHQERRVPLWATTIWGKWSQEKEGLDRHARHGSWTGNLLSHQS